MSTLTLTYNAGAGDVSQSFRYLSIKGLDPVDSLDMWPGRQYRSLAGTFTERINSFNREIYLRLGTQPDYNDRLFLGRFVIAATKKLTITYDNDVDEAAKNIVTVDADTTPGVVTVQVTAHGYSNGDLILIAGTTGDVSPTINGYWRIENKAANTFELVDCTGRSGVGGADGTVTRIVHSITETDLEVVLQNPQAFNTEWLFGSENARDVVLELVEKTTRSSFPT